MGQIGIRQQLEEIANKNNLTGSATISMIKSYGEDCFNFTPAFKDEIFENSDFSYFISKVLEHLPISHSKEIYNLYTSEFSPNKFPNKYVWCIDGEIFTIDEVNLKYLNNPLYDIDKQNVIDIGTPLYDCELLTEFIYDRMHDLHDTLFWDFNMKDQGNGYAEVTAKLFLTLDQIVDLPEYALSGWEFLVKLPGEIKSIRG